MPIVLVRATIGIWMVLVKDPLPLLLPPEGRVESGESLKVKMDGYREFIGVFYLYIGQ